MNETEVCHHYCVNPTGSDNRIPEQRNRDFPTLFLDDQHVPYSCDNRFSFYRIFSGPVGWLPFSQSQILNILSIPIAQNKE
jgi:hypothetical protein